MQKRRLVFSIASSALMVLTFPRMVAAQEDEEYYKPGMPGVVTSMEAFNSGTGRSFDSLLMQTEYLMRSNSTEQALQICREALRMNSNDADIHQLYAEILEKKLLKQVDKDPELYNKVVKEWLGVYRNEHGEERGLYWHGVGLPHAHKFDDEGRQMVARAHLVNLTGRCPGNFETNAKYMQRVSKKTEQTVAGRVVKKGAGAEAQKGKEDGRSGSDSKNNDRTPIAHRHLFGLLR